MSEKYYTVEQVAKLIELHPKTIQRYIREGRIKAQKVGKEWRITGHALSTFVEGTGDVTADHSVQNVQEILGAAMNDIKVSAVLDIPVRNHSEVVKVANWINSLIISRPSHSGYTSMTSQYIEPENIIRILLWGDPAFVEGIMRSLSEIDRS